MRTDHGTTVKEETIEDAIVASDFLKKDPRIDSNRIFILGHSMGGMLAPRIDAEGGNFAAKLSSKFRNIYNLTDEESKSTLAFGKHVRAYYFKEMGEHPSSDYLSVLDKPILIMQGDKDFHVSVERDFNAYKALLAKKEYEVAQHVEKHVINDIAEWIFSI